MRLIASIDDPDVARTILRHLDLATRLPPRGVHDPPFVDGSDAWDNVDPPSPRDA